MRRTAIALSAVALTVTLGACAGQNNSGGQDAAPQDSGKPFTDVASLVSHTGSSMGDKNSVTVGMDISGAMPMPGMDKMECQVDIAKTAMSCAGGPTELVTTPEAMYMKSPGGMGADPGKPWMKMPTGPDNPMTKQLGSYEKLTDFQAMLPPGSTITNSGREKVDGKDTTRYETVTDLNKAIVEGPEESKQGLRMFADNGVTELKQTIWVDAEQLPVKATSTTPPMTMMGQQIPESTITVTYKDWGKPVTITEPPADQIQEMPSMPAMPG